MKKKKISFKNNDLYLILNIRTLFFIFFNLIIYSYLNMKIKDYYTMKSLSIIKYSINLGQSQILEKIRENQYTMNMLLLLFFILMNIIIIYIINYVNNKNVRYKDE